MRLLTYTILILVCYKVCSDASSVEDAFNQFMIPSSAIPVAPESLLYVRFGDKEATLGNILETYEVVYPPYMWFRADTKSLYTLLIIDIDQPSSLLPYASPYLSFLTINIPGSNVLAGNVISPYVPPSPVPGSTYHRYVYLVYEQNKRINPNTTKLLRIPTNFSNFQLMRFTFEYNLTEPVAGNFFLSQMPICNNKPTMRITKC